MQQPMQYKGKAHSPSEDASPNISNGASSTTDGLNSSARSHSPIEKDVNYECTGNHITLPQLHLTCCNFFKPSFTLQKQKNKNKIKGNLELYFAHMSENVRQEIRKIYTSKGRRRENQRGNDRQNANEIRIMTNINFYKDNSASNKVTLVKERPDSRVDACKLCDSLGESEKRPCTSIRIGMKPRKAKAREDSMFSIDEEQQLMSDD